MSTRKKPTAAPEPVELSSSPCSLDEAERLDRDRDSLTIYHNPKCSKSRETLALIRDSGIEPRVIEYLKTPPGPALPEDVVNGTLARYVEARERLFGQGGS